MGTWPEMGSQRSHSPTTRISMMPSQKLGIDWPNMAKSMMPPSSGVLRRAAERMPIGIASRVAKRMAKIVSSSVAGMRSMTSSKAGVRERSELPRSSVASPTT